MLGWNPVLPTQKIKILKKKKNKTPGDIIILHKCTINGNHMMYDSWDMKRDRLFCHFGLFFALLHSPPNNPKNQNFEKLKKISFYTRAPKIIIICYSFLDMVRNECNCYFSLWVIFCPFTTLTTQKVKIKKNAWRYHYFTIVYQKSW